MNSPFPLYNQLIKKVSSDKCLTDDDKLFFIDKVKQLQYNDHELIFALIRTYQVFKDGSTNAILPYGSKYQKNGIKFDFDKFPLELQNILFEFICLCTNLK